MKLRGGEFSTGTTGNFQPELTQIQASRRFPLRDTARGISATVPITSDRRNLPTVPSA